MATATISPLVLIATILVATACASRQRFTVHQPPLPAAEVRDIETTAPRIDLSIQVADFLVRDDTEFPEDERVLLRRTQGVALANALQAALGAQNAFARVVRREMPTAPDTDLAIEGDYRLFLRAGPGRKGNIPWYGRYASISGAWTRERLAVRVRDRSGREVWRGEFEDEHRLVRRAVDDPAFVPWMTQEFVSRVATGILEAVEASAQED